MTKNILIFKPKNRSQVVKDIVQPVTSQYIELNPETTQLWDYHSRRRFSEEDHKTLTTLSENDQGTPEQVQLQSEISAQYTGDLLEGDVFLMTLGRGTKNPSSAYIVTEPGGLKVAPKFASITNIDFAHRLLEQIGKEELAH